MRGPTVSLIFFLNGVITLVKKSSIASVIFFSFTKINISLHTASCEKIRTQNVLGQIIYILEVDGILLSGANIQENIKEFDN